MLFNLPITRQISHLRRYRYILNVFVRHGFGFALNLLPTERQWLRRLRAQPIAEPQTLPAHFRQALEELGPTFVKLGQVLSTRPDLLPPDYIAELARLQDKVPPVPWEEIYQVLSSELHAQPESIFRAINPKPMAAASLGQVHDALLPGGDRVVIKIQRPNILRTIETDLQILQDVARYAQLYTPLGRFYNLEEIASEFSETLHAELDYRREGHNADRFRANFAHERGVYIPRVYWEFSTERVLVLEHISGIKIDHVAALDAAGHDRKQLTHHAATLIIKQVLEDGFFHADPHPGNLIVMQNGAIGVMDFGMVGYISDQDRVDLIRIYTVAIQMDAGGVVDELVHIGAAQPETDRRTLARDINIILRRYYGRPLQEINASKVINEVRPIVFEHRLQLPSNFWLLAKSLVMMEGVGRRLDPDFDIFAFSKPYVKNLLMQAVLPNRRWLEGAMRRGMVWGDLLDTLPRTGKMLLERLERREPLLLSLDERSLNRLDHLVTRMVLSLIITGMIIGLGLVIPGSMESNLILRLILIGGFILSLGLAGWLIISIIRK